MTEKLGETCGEVTHELKTDPHVFQAVIDKKKLFEIRKDDRRFKVGDTLRLRETVHTSNDMKNGKPLEYTGRALVCKVTYALRGPIYGLSDEWVILSIAPVEPNLVVTHSPDANVERDAQLIREAFEEGFRMRGELDPNSPNGCAWRSAEEAWLNSDVEEKLTK